MSHSGSPRREERDKLATIKAVIIYADATVEPVELDSGYKSLQEAVGGNFDLVVSATGKTSFWCHDEGKMIGLPINTVATKLLWKLNPAFDGADVLVGPIVISGGANDEGETLDINDEALTALNLK